MPMPCFSTRAKYSRQVRQSGVIFRWSYSTLSALTMASLSGAADPPSPVISVVMPWKIFDGSVGSTSTVSSDCPSMSMKPGATIFPCASIVCFAGAPARRPIAAIRPSRMATSAAYQGEPVPSITRPLAITRS